MGHTFSIIACLIKSKFDKSNNTQHKTNVHFRDEQTSVTECIVLLIIPHTFYVVNFMARRPMSVKICLIVSLDFFILIIFCYLKWRRFQQIRNHENRSSRSSAINPTLVVR